MTIATGIGSWPGTDVREAVRAVRDLHAGGLPYVPELPARGPGADMIGRTASLLEGLTVDLQPSGWRFVDRPGRDAGRATAFVRTDLDELAEAYDGYTGRIKVQVAGPWTLAASINLGRGERAVSDPGACRDIAESLAEGIRGHVQQVQALMPAATLVVQVDEPSLPAVLAGAVPTSSGYGRVRAVDEQVAIRALQVVTEALACDVRVHCCADLVPWKILRQAGVNAVAVDISGWRRQQWEHLAEQVESGCAMVLGCVAGQDGSLPEREAVVRVVREGWQGVGLPVARLAAVEVSPSCGLAGQTWAHARRASELVRDIAAELAELAHA